MAGKHLEILKQGVDVWNTWRGLHPELGRPDLNGADLRRAKLSGADLGGANLSAAKLSGADLSEANLLKANLSTADLSTADLSAANLSGANLFKANLSGADLSAANLSWADLGQADLSRASLSAANLSRANLSGANLSEANLSRANLERASLVGTILEQTTLTGCKIYGLSVWDIHGTPKDQSGLIITAAELPEVTVDDLEVAQFVSLLLNREKLRNVLHTITSKAVLILGRFTPERKAVLDAMADELREQNLLPIIFDFERSTARDFTETIKILAGLSLFVIADITNPKSAPLELQATVPDYQIPFIPIIQQGETPFSMFSDLPNYDWVLTPIVEYSSLEKLLQSFKPAIIDRAWQKHQALQRKKAEALNVVSVDAFLGDNEEHVAR
jgi:uncharacterized protein YjbI with pentapeptide repeats